MLFQLLWDLCDPTELVGEGGYYLTQFESAVFFISTWQQQDPSDDQAEIPASTATPELSDTGRTGSGKIQQAVMPVMPRDSISEDSPAVAALEAEILTLMQEKRASM